MAANGVRIALQAISRSWRRRGRRIETLKALREGVAPGALTNQPSGALMKQWMREGASNAASREFMGDSQRFFFEKEPKIFHLALSLGLAPRQNG
jgi:hypothetical protein